jgi:predicted porin
VSITYDKGPFAATGVWQRVQNGDGISPASASTRAPLGFSKQDTWQLGASYDAGFVKLFGQLMHVRTAATEDTSTQVWSMGASVPVGAGHVLAQYGNARANVAGTEPLHRIFSLGYDYNLSRRTDIYAVYMNERLSGLPSGNTFAGGMRLRF